MSLTSVGTINGPAIVEPQTAKCSTSDTNDNDNTVSMSSSFASILGMLNNSGNSSQLQPQKRLRLDLLTSGPGQNNASSPDDERDSSVFASNCSLHSPSALRNEFDGSEFEAAMLRGGSLNLKLLRAGVKDASCSDGPRQHLTVGDLRRTITWRSIKRNYEFMMREAIITSSNEKLSESESDSCMKLVASINESLERSSLASQSTDGGYPRVGAPNGGKKFGVIEFFQQVNELHGWFDTLEARMADCDSQDAAACRSERLIALDYLLAKLREKLPFVASLRDYRRELAVRQAKPSAAQIEEQFDRLEARWRALADCVHSRMLRDTKHGFERAALDEIELDVAAFADWIDCVEQSHFIPFRQYVRTRVNLHDLTVMADDDDARRIMLEVHPRLQNEIEARSRFITAVLKACDMLGRRAFLLQRDAASAADCSLPERLRTLKQAVALLQNDLHQKWLEWLEFKFLIEQLALADSESVDRAVPPSQNTQLAESATSNESSAQECDSDEASGSQTQFQLELESAPHCTSTPTATARARKRVRQRRSIPKHEPLRATERGEPYATSVDSGKCSYQADQFSPPAYATQSQVATPTCQPSLTDLLHRPIANRCYLVPAVTHSDADAETPRFNQLTDDLVLPASETTLPLLPDITNGLNEFCNSKTTEQLIDDAERIIATGCRESEGIDDATADLMWDHFAIVPVDVEPDADADDDADARDRADRFVQQIWDLELAGPTPPPVSLPFAGHAALLNAGSRRSSLMQHNTELAELIPVNESNALDSNTVASSGDERTSECDEMGVLALLGSGQHPHTRALRRANGRRRAERHFELRMKAQIAATRRKEKGRLAVASADSSPAEPECATLKVVSACSSPNTPRKRSRRTALANARRSKQIRRALFDEDGTTSGRDCETATDDGRLNTKSDTESVTSLTCEDDFQFTRSLDSTQRYSLGAVDLQNAVRRASCAIVSQDDDCGSSELLRTLNDTICDAERNWTLLRAQVADSVASRATLVQQNVEQIVSIRTALDGTTQAADRELRALLNAKVSYFEGTTSAMPPNDAGNTTKWFEMSDSLASQVGKWTQFGAQLTAVSQSASQFSDVLCATRSLLDGLEQHTNESTIDESSSSHLAQSDWLPNSADCNSPSDLDQQVHSSDLETLLGGLNEVGRTVESAINALYNDQRVTSAATVEDTLVKTVSAQLTRLLLTEFKDLYARIDAIRQRLETLAADSAKKRVESKTTATEMDVDQQDRLIHRNVATVTWCMDADASLSAPLSAPVLQTAPSGRRWMRRYAKMCLLVFGCLLGLTLYFALMQSDERDSHSCEYNAMVNLRSRFVLENRPPPV